MANSTKQTLEEIESLMQGDLTDFLKSVGGDELVRKMIVEPKKKGKRESGKLDPIFQNAVNKIVESVKSIAIKVKDDELEKSFEKAGPTTVDLRISSEEDTLIVAKVKFKKIKSPVFLNSEGSEISLEEFNAFGKPTKKEDQEEE